jgi:pimeloyl-ACP methyl ester carboxylesterase
VAVVEAGLTKPVLVGHSASAPTASIYVARHPACGVIAVEGTLEVAGFAAMARSVEPVLRGPGFDEAWGRISTRMFRTEQVSPDIQDFVRATSRPRQEIVLGYWQDLFERTPQDLEDLIARTAGAIRESGMPYVGLLGEDPSPADVAWLRTNLPDARTEVWPHSGHFPHLAHPRRFAELLAETASWVDTTAPTPVGR